MRFCPSIFRVQNASNAEVADDQVAKLALVRVSNKDIFRFDISMNYVVVVQECNGTCNRSNGNCRVLVIKRSFGNDDVEQFLTAGPVN